MEKKIIHNEEAHKFEVMKDGSTAYIRYMPFKGGLDLVSTYVPAELEGQGVASTLTKYVLEYAKSHYLKIIPTCSFTVAYIRRHPEYKVMVVE